MGIQSTHEQNRTWGQPHTFLSSPSLWAEILSPVLKWDVTSFSTLRFCQFCLLMLGAHFDSFPPPVFPSACRVLSVELIISFPCIWLWPQVAITFHVATATFLYSGPNAFPCREILCSHSPRPRRLDLCVSCLPPLESPALVVLTPLCFPCILGLPHHAVTPSNTHGTSDPGLVMIYLLLLHGPSSVYLQILLAHG